MKLVATKDMKENVYKVKLDVLDITDTDREKFSDFGEPIVNVGGVITEKRTEEKFVPIRENVMITETQIQMIKQTQPVLDDNGDPVLDGEGNPVTQEIDVEQPVQVQVPQVSDEGEFVMIDKLDENGKPLYQVIEEEVEAVLVDLGTQLRKFPSEFPMLREFPVLEFGEEAEKLALLYINKIKAELETQIKALDAKRDNFSGVVEMTLEV